jgi:hypothetical protein
MRKITNILIASALLSIYNCESLSETRYRKAYEVILKNSFDKETSIKKLGKDISGVYVYDSVYAYIPTKVNDSLYVIYSWMTSEKKEKPLYRDLFLSKLSEKYYNKNWLSIPELTKIYGKKYYVAYKQDSLIGPVSTVIFSKIENNKLRADNVPFFVGKPKYCCGSVPKYLFEFKGRKIIKQEQWRDDYECFCP